MPENEARRKESKHQNSHLIPRERSRVASIGVVLGMFFGGPLVGIALASILLRGSDLGKFLCFVCFPAVLVVGYHVWHTKIAGAAVAGLITKLLQAFWRVFASLNRPTIREVLADQEEANRMLERTSASAFAFTNVGIVIGIISGLVAGITAPEGHFVLDLAVFLVANIGYGLALTHLARAGFLLPPVDL